MTTTLKWRLSKLPSVEELQNLVKDKIITQEEARGILFNQETEEDRDKESLKSEIKFLRETVESLSKNNHSKIVEVVKEVKPIWYNQTWYKPYEIWCSNTTRLAGSGLTNSYSSTLGTTTTSGLVDCSFAGINTF